MKDELEILKKLVFYFAMVVTFAAIVSLLYPSLSCASVVQITSSTVGKRLTTNYQHAPFIMLGPSFAPYVAVWVKKVPLPSNGSDPCPTALTNTTLEGRRFSIDPTDKYPIGWRYEESLNTVWCGILESGSVGQNVYIEE